MMYDPQEQGYRQRRPLQFTPSSHEGAGTLLLIDPDPARRELLRPIFAEAGYLVEEAWDLPTLFAALSQRSIDGILMGGERSDNEQVEALRAIRTLPASQGIPLLVLVNEARETLVEALLLAGADEIIPFPPPRALLRHRLNRLIAARRAENLADLFSCAIEAVESGVCITDPHAPDNPIIYVNPAFERLTGYPASEIMGQNCRFLQGAAHDSAPLAELRQALAEQRSCTVELLNVRKDGTPFWNHLSISPVFRDGQLINFVGLQRDVTAQREQEAALAEAHASEQSAMQSLRESEMWLQHIISQLPAVVWTVDRDLRLQTSYSNALQEPFRSSTRHIGHSLYEVFGTDDPEYPPIQAHHRALRGETATYERRVGEQIFGVRVEPLRRDGALIGAIAVAVDITERYQAARIIQESEGRFRAAIEALTEGILVFDQAGLIQVCNGSAERILGLAEVDIVGSATLDGPWEVVAADGSIWREGSFPWRLTLGDGAPRTGIPLGLRWPNDIVTWLSINTQPLFQPEDHRPYGVVASFTDMSERYESERKLRESEAYYRVLAQNASDLVAINDAQGVVHYISPSVTRILGYAPEELIGRASFDFLHPEDLARIVQSFRAKTESQALNTPVIIRFRHKEGGWRVIEAVTTNLLHDPLIQGMVVNGHDVTERYEAETALRESEARLAGIIDSAMDAIVSLDEQQRIVLFNPAAEAMFGYRAAEIMGRPLDVLIPPEARAAHHHHIFSFSQSGVAARSMNAQGELRGMHANGTAFPIEASISQIQLGQTRLYTAIVRDITQRRQIEQQVIRGERLAALGRLAATLAHEVNNPLQAILGQLDLVLDYPLDPAEQRIYLDRTRQEIERLGLLAQRVLNVARPARVPRRVITVGELIAHTQMLVQKQLQQRGLTLTITGSEDARVRVAADQMTQVFLNLLLNAIDAAPEGGALEIAVSQSRESLHIGFINDGAPIPPHLLTHIFEPFFTTKAEGNGMGLAVCHSIIVDHGGSLTVENLTERPGVAFHVSLPIYSDDAESP